MSLQLDTSNAHDAKVIEKMNKMLSVYDNSDNVLEIILSQWCDDSNLESIATTLEERAFECGVHESGDYVNGELITNEVESGFKTMKSIINIFGDYDRSVELQSKVKTFIVDKYLVLERDLISDIVAFYKIDPDDLFDFDGVLLIDSERNI